MGGLQMPPIIIKLPPMITTWTTESRYVDIDTGELIDKIQITNQKYEIIKKNSTATTQNGKAKKILTFECRKKIDRQTTIFG